MLLTPKVDYDSDKPIYMQLRQYIVDEMAKGHLVKGEKLPSVRTLSAHLGLSRNSIENTYNQLLAEGYIESKERSGYYVSDIKTFDVRTSEPIFEVEQTDIEPVLYDFKNEYVSEANFDYRLWKKHLNHILNYDFHKLYRYGTLRGEMALRVAIAKYFYRTRGVVAPPSQIVIGGGVSPLLTMLTNLLDVMDINAIGMEDPGFNKARGIFEYSHLKVVPIPVNKMGMDTQALQKTNARLCYVSPSHQFPTGYVMPIKNRQKLLDWANAVDGYIIEDDYNSELRFEGKPIPAMQGMDVDERVIYLGSFSTVLAPAIRVSFMVLPKRINDLLDKDQGLFSQSASILEQLALAHLIEVGDFEKHIRKIRSNYAKKQTEILRLIEAYLPKSVHPSFSKSGLGIVLHLKEGLDEAVVIKACKEANVLLMGMGDYLIQKNKKRPQQIILSYRGIDESLLDEGIKRIGQVLYALDS